MGHGEQVGQLNSARLPCSGMRNRPLHEKLAFTIIELMVVIAIIAILVSLLAPALSGAKRKAQSLQCRYKVRQWGLAFKYWTDDNDDLFCYKGTERMPIDRGPNTNAWYNVIPPKMGKDSLTNLYEQKRPPLPHSRTMFNCPTPLTRRAVTNVTKARPWFMYGMNGRLVPTSPSEKVREADLQRPDQTILFTDTHERFVPYATGAYFLARHDLKSSCYFLDGHTESVKSNFLYRTRRTDGSAAREWATNRMVYWFPHPRARR